MFYFECICFSYLMFIDYVSWTNVFSYPTDLSQHRQAKTCTLANVRHRIACASIATRGDMREHFVEPENDAAHEHAVEHAHAVPPPRKYGNMNHSK